MNSISAPSTPAAPSASARLICLISSSCLPSRQALADSPRSPKLRQTTVTSAPREAARAIAPPARQTKSPACALTTSTGSCCVTTCPRPAVRSWRPARTASPRAPDLLCGLDDQPELVPLLLRGEVVALLGRGEAALRGQAELIGVDEPGRVLDPPLQLVLALQLAALGGDKPEDHPLALGHEPQRLEATRALVVPLTEEPVHGKLVEQRLGHELITALGCPHALIVAPAHVGGDRHIGGPAGQRAVDVLDVALMLVLGVPADLRDVLALRRVVHVGQAGVVELQVAAAEVVQPPGLLGVGRDQVGPEPVHVRVDRLVDGAATAPVVHHAQRGDGELGQRGGGGGVAKERERLAEDRVLE